MEWVTDFTGIPSDYQGNGFYGMDDSLSQGDDLAGMAVNARRAVQAYRRLGVVAKREQISSLLGVDEYA